jgi:succinyl-diaminopimelate desuccinylase
MTRCWLALCALTGLAAGACSDSEDTTPPAPAPAPTRVPLETLRTAAETATDPMARFLAETITYPSIEAEGKSLLPETEALVEAALSKGRELGFTTRRAAGGLVGVLECGTGTEVVGALIHLDVVPPGNLDEWQHPPFAGVIADGKVFGRGAQDDKAALVGVLWAAKILIDNKMTFSRKLRVILGTKEETSFEDMRAYFAEESPPDFGIVPDSPYIVRGESGYADLGYAFAGIGGATGSSARDTVIHWQGGSAVNSVPDFSFAVLESGDPAAAADEIRAIIAQVTQQFSRGELVPELAVSDFAAFAAEHDVAGVPAGDLVVSSRGVIAHSSTPQVGRNAVVEVALVGARMASLSDNAFLRAFRFVDDKIGLTTDGSRFGLATEKPIAEAADTTASLDIVTTDAARDQIELIINYRVGVANTVREIKEKSGASAVGYGATVREVGTLFDAYYYPDDDPLLNIAKESYTRVRDKQPILLAVGATTYVKAAPNLISFGPTELSEDGFYIHTTDEQIPVAALTRNAVLYAHILQELIQAKVAPTRE